MFSADAKNEIAAASFECKRCAQWFLRGLLAFGAGSALVTDRPATARAVLRAAKLAGIRLHAQHHPNGRHQYSFALPGGKPGELPPRTCCRRAALRAAFLACGSVADPRRGYHLEFYCRSDDAARMLAGLLAALGVDAGITHRRRRALLYIKGASAVADVLGLMGAARAVLALDDVLAVRHTKNLTRRRVNSEVANAARSATTAARQREAALRVSRGRRHEVLSSALREAAHLRIAHPDSTLSELAAKARPPITKSAMARRLREIEHRAKTRRAVE